MPRSKQSEDTSKPAAARKSEAVAASEEAKRSGPPPDPTDDGMPKPLAPLDADNAPEPTSPGADVPLNYTPTGDAEPIVDPRLSPRAQQPGESVEDFEKRTGYRHNPDQPGTFDASVTRDTTPR